jgi:hypothetical protein
MFTVDAVHALKRSRREPMPTLDLALYGVHVAFWAAWGRRNGPKREPLEATRRWSCVTNGPEI